MSKKTLAALFIAMLALVAGLFVWPMFGSANGKPVPANRSELCRIIGLNPETEPACHDIGSLPILETAFPLKVATLEQVREELGSYLVNSWSTPYGTYESYAIAPGLLGPILGQFRFDKDGILMVITIED